MITIRLNKNTVAVPTRWSEVDEHFRDGFIRMCPWLEKFETGHCSFEELKTGIAVALLGISPARVMKGANETLAENVFRIAEQTSFPYILSEPDEQGVQTVHINIQLPRNLQPTVIGKGKLFSKTLEYCTHNFTVNTGGIIICDIDAALYADTLDLLDIYSSSRDNDTLDLLFSRYYGDAKVGRDVKLAFYYNLRGYLDWVRKLPDYSLLFSKDRPMAEGPKAPAPLGSSSGIYTLSKSGYGTLDEIKRLPLFEYLGAMVQIVVDNIRELAAMKMKPGEIAEKLGLAIEQVIPYVSTDK